MRIFSGHSKDLRNVKYFLGMEIARSNMGITVSQRKYVLDLLKDTRMLGCKSIDTPMDYTIKLGTIKGSALVDKGRYQRLVGKLIYLSHTRPNNFFFCQCVITTKKCYFLDLIIMVLSTFE